MNVSTLPQCLRSEAQGSDERIAYRDRGNRCEGVYEQPVSGGINLQLVGYQIVSGPITLDRLDYVDVRVIGMKLGDKPTLRVLSVRPGLFYQMDTSQIGGDGGYTWPSAVLREVRRVVGFEAGDLAAIACSNACRAEPETRYWPVAVGALQDSGSSTLMLVLRTAVELGQLRMTVTSSPGTGVVPVRGTYFSPDRAIRITLPALTPGPHQVTITGSAPESPSRPGGTLRATLIVPSAKGPIP
jgi:hypothetical protein